MTTIAELCARYSGLAMALRLLDPAIESECRNCLTWSVGYLDPVTAAVEENWRAQLELHNLLGCAA